MNAYSATYCQGHAAWDSFVQKALNAFDHWVCTYTKICSRGNENDPRELGESRRREKDKNRDPRKNGKRTDYDPFRCLMLGLFHMFHIVRLTFESSGRRRRSAGTKG